jgi:hypothetical protein
MNAHFARDIVDYRHTELLARAAQATQANRPVRAAGTRRSTTTIAAVRRPFSALHAWVAAGAL